MFFIDYFIRGVRDDIEQEDEIESYLRFMEENPHLGLPGDDEEEVYEYDADGNIIGTEKKVNNSGFFFSSFCNNYHCVLYIFKIFIFSTNK